MDPLLDYIEYSGKAVREARKARQWSINDFAEKLGVSLGKASMIENEQKNPNTKDLRRMTELFGKPIVVR